MSSYDTYDFFISCQNVLNLLNIPLVDLKETPHFCAGFYIVSKDHFDEKLLIELLNRLIDIQKTYQCFNFGTQTVMNLMHIQNRLFVDKLWNLPPNDRLEEIKIIHWNGLEKPWNDEMNIRNKKWWEYNYKLKEAVSK